MDMCVGYAGYASPMTIATAMAAAEQSSNARYIGTANESQSPNLTPDAAATATIAPLVGVTSSVRPAPYWNASTVTCRDRPIRSDTGTSTGIVSTAWPPTLGTGPWMIACTPIIAIAH